jgi:hypothetical protein
MLTPPNWSHGSRFSAPLTSMCVLHFPPNPSRFNYFSKIRVRVQNRHTGTNVFILITFIFLSPNDFLATLFSNTLSLTYQFLDKDVKMNKVREVKK